MNNTLIVSRDLDKTQRDLSDANQALAAYWGRGLTDTDYKCADLHMAAEALMRAISSVANAVDRLAALPFCDGGQ
jgi:hypothetical protein